MCIFMISCCVVPASRIGGNGGKCLLDCHALCGNAVKVPLKVLALNTCVHVLPVRGAITFRHVSTSRPAANAHAGRMNISLQESALDFSVGPNAHSHPSGSSVTRFHELLARMAMASSACSSFQAGAVRISWCIYPKETPEPHGPGGKTWTAPGKHSFGQVVAKHLGGFLFAFLLVNKLKNTLPSSRNTSGLPHADGALTNTQRPRKVGYPAFRLDSCFKYLHLHILSFL